MAITTDFNSGRIHLGDTKRLRLTPKDGDDASITLSTISAVFTNPSGTDTTKTKTDFTESGSGTSADPYVYTLNYTFNAVGWWAINITVASGGATEVESDRVYVHALETEA